MRVFMYFPCVITTRNEQTVYEEPHMGIMADSPAHEDLNHYHPLPSLPSYCNSHHHRHHHNHEKQHNQITQNSQPKSINHLASTLVSYLPLPVSILGLFTPSASSVTSSSQTGVVGGQIIYPTGLETPKIYINNFRSRLGNGNGGCGLEWNG